MQIEDTRNKATAICIEDLSISERDQLSHMIAYLQKPRMCSLCQGQFALSKTLGRMNSKHPQRDHVDFDNEDIGTYSLFSLPYRVFMVLKTTNLLNTEGSDVQFLRDHNDALTDVKINRCETLHMKQIREILAY